MSETVQQRTAIDARGKTIVSAAAGSGKTRVMVSRFVELVTSEGADVRSMLAVTFTNKAAAQMRDRIRKALLEAIRSAESENDRQKAARLKEQLRALPLADICTIHAFCGRLIRTYFYLVDVDPAFRIVGTDDAEGQALSARALNRTFERAYEEGGEEFARLLSVYFRKKKDTRLKDMVKKLYTDARGEADYLERLTKIAAGEEDFFEKAESVLTADFKRRASHVLARSELVREQIPSAPPKVQDFYSAIVEAARRLLSAPNLFVMRELVHDIPTSPRRTAKMEPETVALLTKLQKLSAQIKDVYGDFKAYHAREEEQARCKSAGEQARALAALTLEYGAAFSEIKREAGVLDYGDLEHLALAILSNGEASNALHEKYRYVFVDEYQDVNPMQEHILSMLAGPDVFLVGDDKQAIYGFRGSRTKYFHDKVEEYACAEGGGSLRLSANFRSATGILDAVNTVFTAVLGDKYIPMEGGALYGDYAGEVHLHHLPEEEEAEETARGVYSVKDAAARPESNGIARKVASLVEEECGRKEQLGRDCYDADLVRIENGVQVKGGLRPVRYGDIAVLVRKNTKAAGPIVAALSERGIPVTASAEVNICDYFEVRLLIDWLSYLDNAEQDIPMVSAMLSVIGGFTDRELALIRLHTREVPFTHTFRDACKAYIKIHEGEKTDPISQKLTRFYEIAERYRNLSRVRTASDMLVLLLADGLEAQIAAKGDSSGRLARVRRLIAESEGSGSVHAFLKRLKDCDYQVDFSETGGENAVHVLTMHASKGLEFPVVILTELDEDFRGPDHDEVMWTDEFCIAPRAFDFERKVYFDTLIRKAAALYEKRQTVEGERNLLYVGMTRACSRLHVIFEKPWERPASEEEERFTYAPDDAKRLSDFIPRMRLLSLIDEEKEMPAFERVESRALEYRADEARVTAIRDAGAPYRYGASTAVPVKDSATGLMRKLPPTYKTAETESDIPMSELIWEESGTHVSYDTETGTAYHAFLEHVDFSADVEDELARMAREGVLGEEQCKLLDVARLKAILAIPCMQQLAGKKLHREQRFIVTFPASDFAEAEGYGKGAANDDVIFQGAIDLLVEEGAGRYTVVDYKFSSHSDEEIRKHYAIQLKLYRKTVSKIMRTPEEKVAIRIVNIAACREIEF